MKKVALIALVLVIGTFTLGFTTVAKPLYYKIYPVVNILVNGNEVKVSEGDVPAFQIDGRTMVPIRLVAETLKADVEWDETTRTVIITKEEYQPPAPTVKPDQKLIKIENISANASQTRISGIIKNANSMDVDVNFTIDFYDRHEKNIGHVHVKVRSLEKDGASSFIAEITEDVRNYSSAVTSIDSLTAY